MARFSDKGTVRSGYMKQIITKDIMSLIVLMLNDCIILYSYCGVCRLSSVLYYTYIHHAQSTPLYTHTQQPYVHHYHPTHMLTTIPPPTHTQVVSLADSEQSVEVEQHLLNSRLKALTAYYGELANAEFWLQLTDYGYAYMLIHIMYIIHCCCTENLYNKHLTTHYHS